MNIKNNEIINFLYIDPFIKDLINNSINFWRMTSDSSNDLMLEEVIGIFKGKIDRINKETIKFLTAEGVIDRGQQITQKGHMYIENVLLEFQEKRSVIENMN